MITLATIQAIFRIIKFAGSKMLYEIIENTFQKNHSEKDLSRTFLSQDSKNAFSPGYLLYYSFNDQGGKFFFANSTLEVHFLTNSVVRISWDKGKPPVPYAIVDHLWQKYYITKNIQGNDIYLSSDILTLDIGNDGTITYHNSSGKVLRKEHPPRFSINKRNVVTNHLATLRESTKVYGMGEQAKSFTLNNTTHKLWNTDPGGNYSLGDDPIYMPMPIYLCLQETEPYLVFYENYWLGEAIFKNNQEGNNYSSFLFSGGKLQYYFIFGSLTGIYSTYRNLTGHPELPPLWSLGYHQSHWGYNSEQEILNIINGFKENQIPISAIHLDIDYLNDYRVFTIDTTKFPDLRKLTKILKKNGIHLVTIIDPGVKIDNNYSVYIEGVKENAFCHLPNGKLSKGIVWPGYCVFPDFTSPRIRDWWKKFYAELLCKGVDGIWHDMNEPATFVAWGDPSLPKNTVHKMENNPGNHLEAHNIYGLLMNKSGYEAMKEHNPQNRPWLLSRSGWISNQQYAWNWTADAESSWKSLQMTVSTILGLGLSGILFSGSDIGGFGGNPSPELYVRWLQLATFLPFYRTHSALGTKPREPWFFDEPYKSIIKKFIALRYKLLPYIYTTSYQATKYGFPLIRPLFWLDSSNKKLWERDDAFLLGDNLLIYPIFKKNQKHKNISLPPGNWFDFWDNTYLDQQIITEKIIHLDEIPVFIRANSIIPIQTEQTIEFHLYLHSEQENLTRQSIFYLDSGDGYGDYLLTTFEINANQLELHISKSHEGNYKFPFPKYILNLHCPDYKKVFVDDVEIHLKSKKVELINFQTIRFLF